MPDLYIVAVPGEQPEHFATDKAAEEYILDLAADFRSEAAADGEWSDHHHISLYKLVSVDSVQPVGLEGEHDLIRHVVTPNAELNRERLEMASRLRDLESRIGPAASPEWIRQRIREEANRLEAWAR